MNIRQMRYFCEVVEFGSAVAAAGRLHIAPTAISMQLSQLEESLGGDLFDRSRRPMEPTALGRFLYPRAKEVLGAVARLEKDSQSVAAGQTGWLAIGYTRSTICSVLPRAVRTFREDRPDVQLDLLTMLSEHQVDKLLDGRIQVGLARYIDPPDQDPALVYRKLFADPFILAVPAGHPLSQHATISARQLTGVPLITYPKDPQSRFAERTLALMRRAGAEPAVAHEAGEFNTALGLVASGLGCCLVGESVSEGGRRDVCFVRFTDLTADTSTVFAVTRAIPPSKALAAFLESLSEAGLSIETERARRQEQRPG